MPLDKRCVIRLSKIIVICRLETFDFNYAKLLITFPSYNRLIIVEQSPLSNLKFDTIIMARSDIVLSIFVVMEALFFREIIS